MTNFHITTDMAAMPITDIHHFLTTEAYWSQGVPRATVERAINNSICICVLDGSNLAAFARVVTDRATFAYLSDVFVMPPYRKQGLAKMMVSALMAHADLQGLRRWMLMTADAHGLYREFGFTPLKDATRAMERHDPDVYRLQQ